MCGVVLPPALRSSRIRSCGWCGKVINAGTCCAVVFIWQVCLQAWRWVVVSSQHSCSQLGTPQRQPGIAAEQASCNVAEQASTLTNVAQIVQLMNGVL
jgi:hypothetical protein